MNSLRNPPTMSDGDNRMYITTKELRKHSSPGDMWLAIQGKVYDVTEWSKDHPGGVYPLTSLAGQDVTDAFIAFHPGSAWTLLNRFYIGILSDYTISDLSRDYRLLHAEFSKLGLYHNKGHVVAITISVIYLIFAVVIYGVLATASPFIHLASACLLGWFWVHSGFVAHDSGHSSIMATDGLTCLAQLLIGNCFAGISIGWWKWNHNAHHVACNSLDYDPDLQHTPLFAVSPTIFTTLNSYIYDRKMNFDAVARLLVSYQHWTFYPIMCISRVYLLAQSLILLFTKKNVPNWWQEILGMIVFWVWYPLLVSCLPNWGERVMFITASFAATAIQNVQFCLSHFSSDVYLGRPQGNDWFEKQTTGTLNVDCPRWMDWFHGGLQFQVEHHLFPRLPRCNLRAVSPIVRELCKKHGLAYASVTFLEANKMTVRTLRNAALQARDLTRAVPKNLVWEAVNTHG